MVLYRAKWDCSHPGRRQDAGNARKTRGTNQFQWPADPEKLSASCFTGCARRFINSDHIRNFRVFSSKRGVTTSAQVAKYLTTPKILPIRLLSTFLHPSSISKTARRALPSPHQRPSRRDHDFSAARENNQPQKRHPLAQS